MLKRKGKRVLSIVLAVAMIVGLFPIAAFAEGGEPATIYVDASATNDDGTDSTYKTLATAVSAANPGDTIELKSNLTIGEGPSNNIVVDKAITIDGKNFSITKSFNNTANADGYGDCEAVFQITSTAGATIKNVKITGLEDGNKDEAGIYIKTGATATIQDCTFQGSAKDDNKYGCAGIITEGNSSNGLTVSDCIFKNVKYAMYFNGISKATITNNNVDTTSYTGIYIADQSASDVTVSNNTMTNVAVASEGYDKSYGSGVYVATPGAEKITVANNNITMADTATGEAVGNVNVAQIGDKQYKTLQEAVTAASTNATTVNLISDITLDSSVMLVSDQNLTINGNGHTISYDGTVPASKVAFKITGEASEMEGTPTGVTLNINNVTFQNTNTTQGGYAVLIGGNSNNTSVDLDQCSFDNLYCAVLGNAFTDTTKADEAPDFSITNSTFTDTQFGYSVDAVTPGAIVGAGNITFTDNKGEVAEQETFTKTEAYVTRNSVTTVASSFTDAITNAQSGDVITLAKNLESETVITLPAGVTLDGNGYTLSYNNTESTPTNGAFITATGNNVVIKNITLDLDGIKHGVQFYCTNGGKIENATINGANWTAVQVNGAQNIELINTTLNPNDGTNAYANIEFSMGKNVTTIPSLTIDGVSFDSQYPAIWVDDDTVAAIKGQLGAGANNDAVSDKITSNITNNNKSDITIVVEFAPGKSENVIAESTYEPPYTGKFSHEIFTTVGDNGAIDVDRYATEGDKVTITVSPDEAYMLDKMTVTSGDKDVEVTDNGDGTYTFTMPSGDVKIEVTFAEDPNWEPEPEEPAMPFVDVNENDWFYDVVLYAYENGLMTGTSADTFAPNQTTTRGMIVSMLARLEGVTNAEDAGFADVAANDWYATAVNWAASVGVVNGYEDNTFRPNAPITREQMAAILYNYADYKGYDVSARADLSDYADAASISSWAEDVLAWANAEGLINGMTATTIDPQGATTRAQTAAMFERFLTAHEA